MGIDCIMESCAHSLRPGVYRAQHDRSTTTAASLALRRAPVKTQRSSSQSLKASKLAPCTSKPCARRVSYIRRASQPQHGDQSRACRAFKPQHLGYGLFLALAGAAWLVSPCPSSQRRATLAATSAVPARAAEAQTASAASQGGLPTPVQLTVVAELGQGSPFGVTWGEVLAHIRQRLQWHDPSFNLVVHDAPEIKGTAAAMERLAQDLVGSQVMVLIGIQDPTLGAALSDLLRNQPTVLALASSPELSKLTRLGGRQLRGEPRGIAALLSGLLPGDAAARADAQVLETVQELFERNTSDDLLFVFLVLTNQYVREVPLVANSTKSQKAGMKELQCMVQNCGRQIFSCYADTSCRTALNCLNSCHFNDQVCSYRCIASYESPQLADFSLCILQKHNCLGLSAEIPMTPDPAPLPVFNGQPMTHQLAEDLFIGWLRDPSSQLPASGQETFSWRVFGGKNPAYDYFPCQFQLFYRGKAKSSMWYDPVFMVKTLDGKMVWRRRHYRVKRGATPGTFHLSVLDNGVTSKEYWRILDCAEDLEWCAFYYSGAAAAAGTAYSGAILGSRSGAWPGASQLPRIEQALERAGIKMWEVSSVDNSGCEGAPLDPSLMAMAA